MSRFACRSRRAAQVGRRSRSTNRRARGHGAGQLPVGSISYAGRRGAEAAVERVDIAGPYDAQDARGQSRAGGGFSCCRPAAGPASERRGVRQADSLHAGPARLSPAGDRRGPDEAARLLHGRPQTRTGFDAGIRTRARADPGRSPSSCSASSAIPPAAPGTRLPPQRRRAGVAAVVLPLEQHSRRRAARRWRSAASCSEPAVLEQQVRRMLADPRATRS